jgi:hypothetical protein
MRRTYSNPDPHQSVISEIRLTLNSKCRALAWWKSNQYLIECLRFTRSGFEHTFRLRDKRSIAWLCHHCFLMEWIYFIVWWWRVTWKKNDGKLHHCAKFNNSSWNVYTRCAVFFYHIFSLISMWYHSWDNFLISHCLFLRLALWRIKSTKTGMGWWICDKKKSPMVCDVL